LGTMTMLYSSAKNSSCTGKGRRSTACMQDSHCRPDYMLLHLLLCHRQGNMEPIRGLLRAWTIVVEHRDCRLWPASDSCHASATSASRRAACRDTVLPACISRSKTQISVSMPTPLQSPGLLIYRMLLLPTSGVGDWCHLLQPTPCVDGW
jgi:hypothetical protein